MEKEQRKKLTENLEARGYSAAVFGTASQAADYISGRICNATVGIGGSVTVDRMGLADRLKSAGNSVYWHWHLQENVSAEDIRKLAAQADVYISSVNGMSEDGVIINIDGTCNRISGMLYGHKKVYLVVGENKIAPDREAALWRARNIAAPLNAKRLGRKTPCVEGGHCFDCKSPERICNAVAELWRAPGGCEYEVVIVEESLGY